MTKKYISHRVEHTCNKHSRAVIKNDTIIIRLAKNLSKTEEREHIEDLLRRMTHHALEERRKKLIHPFRTLLKGEEKCTVRLPTGKKYTFMLYPGKKTHALRTVDGWVVFVGPQTKRRSLHTFCWSLLAEAESPRIEDLVDRINEEEFGVRIRDIRLKFASSQWGSCSPRGIVMLNAALLLAPPSVLRYVISHELAHFEHPNHSKDFWREVRRVMPTYKRAMNTIHNYRLPTL